MASAEILTVTDNLAAQMESKLSPDFSQLRPVVIDAFLHNFISHGILATSEGRFHGVFVRDAATAVCLALEKDQNGSSELLLEGARRTLITGAEHQGTKYRRATRERVGAIFHEYHGPESDQEYLAVIHRARDSWVQKVDDHFEGINYRALDSPAWWICLFADYIKRSQDFTLMEQLWPNFEAAVARLNRYGRRLVKGGFEYGKPPRNLGWKDSEDAFIDEEGNYPAYPVAPLDVNCVFVRAHLGLADLYDLKDDRLSHKKARAHRARAHEHQEMIDKLYWLEEYSVYAPAVDAYDKPVRIRTSDSVYALWAGITDGKSRQIAQSTLESDLFVEGRGLRTRSTFSNQFSTRSYQNGPVWYHLAPMAGAACEKLGLLEEANKFDSCVPTIVREGFPELDNVDRDGKVSPYIERHPETGQEMAVGCKNFTMTIGAVLNRLTS